MLVSHGFAQSIQAVPPSGGASAASTASAAAAAMGPYYPRAAVCPLSTLVAEGTQGCLAHP
jgi:hypothetical protein